MTFMELLLSAKLGSTSAFEELFARYKNLLRKYSVVNGVFDEDLYQEQCVLFVRCIEIFDVNPYSQEKAAHRSCREFPATGSAGSGFAGRQDSGIRRT